MGTTTAVRRTPARAKSDADPQAEVEKSAWAPIGHRIMASAYARGIKNQKQLADRLRTSRQNVGRWVRGQTSNMTHRHLFKLADFLGKSARWIAFGKGPETDSISVEQREILEIAAQLGVEKRATWMLLGRQLRDATK